MSLFPLVRQGVRRYNADHSSVCLVAVCIGHALGF